MTEKKRAPKINLNPSSAERWTTCTASPRFIFDNWDKLPPHDTIFNQEGTTAHEVAAALLQDREVNPANCPVPPDGDMHSHAWDYSEYVLGLKQPKGVLNVEQKLPLFYNRERNAVVDASVRNPDSLHIVDYKYGAGVAVSAEENLQAIIYARTVCWNDPPKAIGMPVFIHIYQPRNRDSDTPEKVWETTWGELLDRCTPIVDTADAILKNKPGLKFAPSEKACRWCPAKGFCDARRQEFTRDIEVLATIEPGPKHLPPVGSVSMRQLQAILEHGDKIVEWLDDAKAYALQFMKDGGSIEGFKLVQSRGGNRYWSNPEVAAKLLLKSTILREEEVYTRKVISVADAEKKLGKHKFDAQLTNLIARPEGAPCIAPVSDKRPDLRVNAESEFTNLDLEDIEL